MCKRRYALPILLFIAAAALTWTAPNAHADPQPVPGRYRDYQIEQLDNSTFRQTLGMVPYVFDGNSWVDRKISNNGTHYNVYSEMGSFSFDKNDCTITQYTKGFNPISQTAHGSDIMINSWAWTIARKNGANPWEVIDPSLFACSISTAQNATGKYLTMIRNHVSGSYLKVTLAAPNDKPIEDFNEFYMNIPGWSGNEFAYVLWAKGVNAQSLDFKNGTTFMIPQGTTLINKTQLNINSLEFVKNGNPFYFDWQKAASKFKSLLLIRSGSNLDLQFGFNRNPVVLTTGQKMFMDPTYGYTAATDDYSVRTGGSAGAICAAGSSKVSNDRQMQKSDTGAGGICIIDALQWDLSTIPNTVIVTNSSVQVQVSAVTNGINCDLTQVTSNITTANVTALYSDIMNGTVYVSNNNLCASTGTKDRDLGASADADIQAQLTGDDLFGLGIKYTNMVRDASAHTMNWIAAGANGFQLRVTYVAGPPDPVTDLHATTTNADSVDLAFSAPGLNGGTLQRYVFNYTSPCGIPLTALPNGTTATTYTVSGLTANTCYSFRASAATEGGYNISGANIVNVTTLAFNAANYTIGSFNFNANNPVLLPIRYERIENGSQTYVNVTFANTISLACDLRYTYAMTNHTYHTITSSAISSTEREAQFRFTNSSNDIVTFRCWNQSGNQSANYVLTQTDFLLKQQVRDFRNGTYGTMGQFGAFDLISLIVIIISLIGLNRNTEAVAGFFCIVAITVLAYFEIVSWVTAIVSAAAVIMLFIVAGTKKT